MAAKLDSKFASIFLRVLADLAGLFVPQEWAFPLQCMTPELRVVTKGFLGKHFAKLPVTGKCFRTGDRLIYYDNDGAHAIFVFENDKNKTQSFVAQTEEFEECTDLLPPVR